MPISPSHCVLRFYYQGFGDRAIAFKPLNLLWRNCQSKDVCDEAVVAWIKILSPNSPMEIEENYENDVSGLWAPERNWNNEEIYATKWAGGESPRGDTRPAAQPCEGILRHDVSTQLDRHAPDIPPTHRLLSAENSDVTGSIHSISHLGNSSIRANRHMMWWSPINRSNHVSNF
jgi:hypothetical protein